jgi:hypothetical protein
MCRVFPCIPLSQAGMGHIGDQESAAYCVQPDLDPRGRVGGPARTSLDPSQDKWRQSFRREPGMRFIHAGLVDADIPPPEYRHGIRTQGGDKAGDVFTTGNGITSELSAFHNEAKESIYRSNIREPVGSGYIRGHQLPARVHEPNFKFGISSNSSENAKDVMYMPTAAPHYRAHGATDTSPLNQISPQDYTKTLLSVTTSRAANAPAAASLARTGDIIGPHALEHEVTQPINREYDWNKAGVDPYRHRFGRVTNANPQSQTAETGVQSALVHQNIRDSTTTIGSKRVEEIRAAQFDHLGKARRNRGQPLAGDPNDPVSSSDGNKLNYTGHRDMTFGRPGSHDEWGARDCIKGIYSDREQMPDADLGRSTFKITSLEHVPARHNERAFGLPSIRADRRPPQFKSVANFMNYGDESNGAGLLYPSQFATAGVNEEDFLSQRDAQQVRSVFSTLGVQFTDKQFDRVSSLAQQRYGALSVDSFRHAWNQVRLGIICEECGALLCQHDDCRRQSCSHTEHANHAPHTRHIKQVAPQQIGAAGFSSNTHPAM